MGPAYSGELGVRSRRVGTVAYAPWHKHMQISTRLVSITLCCGLCVLLIGLRLYSTDWLQSALQPSASQPVIVERSATRQPNPPKQVRPTVDEHAYLIERDTFYQRVPAKYAQNRRIDDQAKLLEAYKKDREGFLKRYEG